jgi:hypothetical protein
MTIEDRNSEVAPRWNLTNIYSALDGDDYRREQHQARRYEVL